MYAVILEVILIFNNFYYTHSVIEKPLANGYLREKSIRILTMYGCFNKQEQQTILKEFSKGDIYVNTINIKDFQNKPVISKFSPIGCILDGDCYNADIFLEKVGKLKMFGRKYKWLIMSRSENITSKLPNLLLNIDADVHVAYLTKSNNLSRWTILDIYNPAHERGGELRIINLGYFNQNDGYRARYKVPKYYQRRNMSDVVFKTQIVLPEQFEGSLNAYLSRDTKLEINTFNRFHHHVIDNCKNFYNYSVEIKHVNSWGYKKQDGTFDGMVGDLQRRLIDFGSSPLFVKSDRGRVIDYGRNTWILRAAFIFRNQKSLSPVKIILNPLSTSIWISIIVCSFLSVLALKFILRFEIKLEPYASNNWSSLILFIVNAFCQQGCLVISDTMCARIVTIFVYFLSLFTYQCYTASIVAQLLMIPNATITTVEGLVKSPMKAGCQDILYERDYFKYTTERWPRELYQKKIVTKDVANFLSPEKGLRLVQEGNYAFNVELATAYPIIHRTFSGKTICELAEIQMLRTQPMHANYQKDSSIKDMMDVCLQRVAECGILHRERTFWHPEKPHCVKSLQSITFEVGLDEFYPALGVLVTGIILSLIVLILEILIYYRQKYRSQHYIHKNLRILPIKRKLDLPINQKSKDKARGLISFVYSNSLI